MRSAEEIAKGLTLCRCYEDAISGCYNSPCECANIIREAQDEALEGAAKLAETYFPKAHTYASENADVYRAQDDAQEGIAKDIRTFKSAVAK